MYSKMSNKVYGKKKSSHKPWGMLALAVIFIAAAAGILLNHVIQQSALVAVQTHNNNQQSEPVQIIEGTVVDATMNTLTVHGEDNCEYCFGTDGVNIATGKTGVVIGNPVSISYRGELASNTYVQNVELLSITITDANLTTNNSEIINVISDNIKPSTLPAAVTQKAQAILNNMNLDEKVGQLFIARCPETAGAQKIAEYHLGGYILFGQDFADKTKNEIIQTIQSYQSAAKIPLFIGVDEEGGTVNRVSTNPNLRAVPFWSPQELYAEGGFNLIQSDTKEKCDLLHSLGINLNFAPICDVSQNSDDFIYDRSFGQNAEQTAAYVRLVVQTMSKESMGSVLKHFPGYGNNADTHTGIAYDNRSYEAFLASDFLPFQAGINSGANMVLVSHNVVSCIDSQTPASLSPQVHKILREELGFTGVIITDDLAMDGVRDFAGDTEIAVQAVQAGNDLLCCTDFETQIPAILEAVKNGKIAESQIDESVLRILELKISLGII